MITRKKARREEKVMRKSVEKDKNERERDRKERRR